MSRHTQGPWRLEPASGSGLPDSCKQYQGKPYKEIGGIIATGPDGFTKGVAFVYQGSGGVGSPEALAEQTANAHLIAAAPELLAACVALLDAQSARRHPLGAPDEGIAYQCAEAASKARSAIAKAEGGAK